MSVIKSTNTHLTDSEIIHIPKAGFYKQQEILKTTFNNLNTRVVDAEEERDALKHMLFKSTQKLEELSNKKQDLEKEIHIIKSKRNPNVAVDYVEKCYNTMMIDQEKHRDKIRSKNKDKISKFEQYLEQL